MLKEELIRKSITMIVEYYRNNYEPFFDFVADDVLWYGPRNGQILRGRDQIIRTWSAARTDLRFSLGSITATSTSTGRNNLEVMLEYYVYTFFPNGESDKHHQRIHYSWGYAPDREKGNKARVPKMYMIHISNISDAVGRPGQVFADSPEISRQDSVTPKPDAQNSPLVLTAKGKEQELYYFPASTVWWIESADNGRHAVVHCSDGTYPVLERLRDFEKNYPDILVRIHASYLVNPHFVASVKRFEVQLADGTTLPIPQKKFTMVRSRLEDWTYPDA